MTKLRRNVSSCPLRNAYCYTYLEIRLNKKRYQTLSTKLLVTLPWCYKNVCIVRVNIGCLSTTNHVNFHSLCCLAFVVADNFVLSFLFQTWKPPLPFFLSLSSVYLNMVKHRTAIRNNIKLWLRINFDILQNQLSQTKTLLLFHTPQINVKLKGSEGSIT